MLKQKKTFADKKSDELTEILDNFNGRITEIENFVVLQSKLLNSNILRSAAIIEILIDKGIIEKNDVDKKAEEILEEIKLNARDSKSENLINQLRDLLNSDDVGHA